MLTQKHTALESTLLKEPPNKYMPTEIPALTLLSHRHNSEQFCILYLK